MKRSPSQGIHWINRCWNRCAVINSVSKILHVSTVSCIAHGLNSRSLTPKVSFLVPFLIRNRVETTCGDIRTGKQISNQWEVVALGCPLATSKVRNQYVVGRFCTKKIFLPKHPQFQIQTNGCVSLFLWRRIEPCPFRRETSKFHLWPMSYFQIWEIPGIRSGPQGIPPTSL